MNDQRPQQHRVVEVFHRVGRDKEVLVADRPVEFSAEDLVHGLSRLCDGYSVFAAGKHLEGEHVVGNKRVRGNDERAAQQGDQDGGDRQHDGEEKVIRHVFLLFWMVCFGCCVLIGQIRDDNNNKSLINLSLELWAKIYEKLFGGFEDLNALKCDNDDEDEDDDELDIIPKSKKTKSGLPLLFLNKNESPY